MRGKRKQIAFDMNTSVNSPSLNYFNHVQETYQIIRDFLEWQGFEKQQSSIYTSTEPMYQRHVDMMLKELAKEMPWFSECTKDINITDVGKRYDLMDELVDHCAPYKKMLKSYEAEIPRFSYKRVLEDKAVNHDILKPGKNDTRKQIAFDLNSASGSPLYKYFNEVDSGRNAYRMIEHFMERYGFEHMQGSVYASKDLVSHKQLDALLKNLCKEMPWLAECSKGFVVTEIGSTYNITQDLKEYCSYYGVARKKMQERLQEKNKCKEQENELEEDDYDMEL